MPPPVHTPPVRARLQLLHMFDVAEAIDLEVAARLMPQRLKPLTTVLRPPFPGYVGFERKPIGAPIDGEPGGQWKIYDYGLMSISIEFPFAGSWADLIAFAAHTLDSQQPRIRAEAHARALFPQVMRAAKQPFPGQDWLFEEYLVIILESPTSPRLTADEMLAAHGADLARVVRGETMPLSAAEVERGLRGHMSYSPDSFVLFSWAAAVIYDTPSEAEPILNLVEHANAQLLEFRYYDRLLQRRLAELYRKSDKFFARMSFSRQAVRLNEARLEVMELAERSEHSLRFFGDMYYARVYKLAAQRIGVDDYRTLLDERLNTAGELLRHLMEQQHQNRALALEVIVVIILLIELGFLFKKGG